MIGKYKEILARVTQVKEQRGAMYRNEPRKTVPLEILEAVALLKAYRGYESLNTEKKIDEYTDLINYACFIYRSGDKRGHGKTPLFMAGMKCLPLCNVPPILPANNCVRPITKYIS